MHLEFFLNLCWLLLAVPAYRLWHDRTDRYSPIHHLVALVCLIALLFPSISASDDLRMIRAATEEPAVLKNLEARGNREKSDLLPRFIHLLSGVTGFTAPLLFVVGIIPATLPRLDDLSLCTSNLYRGPPLPSVLM